VEGIVEDGVVSEGEREHEWSGGQRKLMIASWLCEFTRRPGAYFSREKNTRAKSTKEKKSRGKLSKSLFKQ
jgi:hypothetical protein